MWERVDEYIGAKLLGSDKALDAASAASDAAGLPAIAVSPLQGRLLELIARSIRARNVLEIGTLGGYSTICLGRSVAPDGRVLSLEYEPRHAQVARTSIDAAGLSSVVEVRVGRALDLLPGVPDDGIGPFDLVFIDADKQSIPRYLEQTLSLTHPGSVVVVDNVVRGGAVVDPDHSDERVQGVRAMVELLTDHPRYDSTVIQTVGAKGYDGFALLRVLD